jgi:hypothetical protein
MSTWTRHLAALASAVVLAGCTCRPTLPPPPPEETDEPEETGETGETGDTAPPPPCAVPEIEANDDPASATELPTEQQGCGGFAEGGDFDWWAFAVDDSGWLAVELEAGPGSISDVSLLVLPIETDEGNAWAAARANDQGATDAHLLFPAPAGTYTINVSEEQLKSGDRYLYELLVSEAKAPVTWNLDEVEPNDTQGTAQLLLDGDAVLARAGSPTDFDWYQVAVPAGKHVVTVDVDAYPEGSIGDFVFVLWGPGGTDAPGCGNACEIRREAPGLIDPRTEYDSSGDETLWIQVLENSGQFGPAAWYRLSVLVEEG